MGADGTTSKILDFSRANGGGGLVLMRDGARYLVVFGRAMTRLI